MAMHSTLTMHVPGLNLGCAPSQKLKKFENYYYYWSHFAEVAYLWTKIMNNLRATGEPHAQASQSLPFVLTFFGSTLMHHILGGFRGLRC